MNGRKSSNGDDQSSKILIFSACAIERGVEWVDGGCSVDNSLLTTKLSKLATNLDSYIGKLHLLDNHHVIDRFERDGSAWVDVYTIKPNRELLGFDTEIETVKVKIQQCIDEHEEIIHEISSRTSKSDNRGRGGNAAVEAFAKCLTTKTDTKLRLDFPNQGTRIIDTIRPIETQINSVDNVESATGEVMCFTENDQKLTLYKLKQLNGQLVLSVLKPIQRAKLLDIQKEKRVINVKFAPTIDQLRPDKSTRSGVLSEIDWIGPTQVEIPE